MAATRPGDRRRRHLLRARGWLTGRLGLCDRAKTWLDEVADSPDFDHLSAAAWPRAHASCRTRAAWPRVPGPARPPHALCLDRRAGRPGGLGPPRRGKPAPRVLPPGQLVCAVCRRAAGPADPNGGVGVGGAGRELRKDGEQRVFCARAGCGPRARDRGQVPAARPVPRRRGRLPGGPGGARVPLRRGLVQGGAVGGGRRRGGPAAHGRGRGDACGAAQGIGPRREAHAAPCVRPGPGTLVLPGAPGRPASDTPLHITYRRIGVYRNDGRFFARNNFASFAPHDPARADAPAPTLHRRGSRRTWKGTGTSPAAARRSS